MQVRYIRRVLGAALLASLVPSTLAADEVTVYAAASLTNALGDLAVAYEYARKIHVVSSFAASSTLAKQIENGAPAEVFISADKKWMDYLEDQNKIVQKSRRNVLSNTLVLIGPTGKGFKVEMAKGFDLSSAFSGKLCTGDPEHVPVGTYARQALTHLGWWDAIALRIVGTEDVRAALAFVERGECPVGIVYETDARLSNKVQTIGRFPGDSHEPIVYPAALVQGAKPPAQDFLAFLASPQARSVFSQYGFIVLEKTRSQSAPGAVTP